MVINYIGQSCFRIRGKETTILFDPFNSSIGKNFPKQSDISLLLVTHAHPDHNFLDGVEKGYFLIDTPGEYDIRNVSINGIFSFHDKVKGAERGTNTIYKVDFEDIAICHLGDLGTILTEEQIQKIGNVNILFIPVGGKYTIDSHDAAEVISQIAPNIVIPMHYGNENLGLAPVEDFLKEMGVEKEINKTLKFTKDDFTDSQDGTKILVMEN